ncbi:DUF1295-domain-containing protein [Atractiella rhizophila]|nr:DUF1295-domain-containing protein [Atractiella rhizophila]
MATEKLSELITNFEFPAPSSALYLPSLLCIVTTGATFILGEAYNNLSQVDRIWTFMPPAYTGLLYYWATSAENNIPEETRWRIGVILALQGAWSARLTWKAYVRGFFSASGETEDYRWIVLKKELITNRFLIGVFDLVFVAVAQNLLLLATCLPSYYLLVHSSRPLTNVDYIVPALYLVNLSLETLADNQQQKYQQWKHSLPPVKKIEENNQRGFCTRGLWRFSRHPNFFHEQLGWYILFLYTLPPSVFSPSSYPDIPTFLRLSNLNWAVYGPLSMTVLFFGSTMFTEWISAKKYPNYRLYRERIAMFDYFTTIWKEGLWMLLDNAERKRNNQVLFGNTVKVKRD